MRSILVRNRPNDLMQLKHQDTLLLIVSGGAFLAASTGLWVWLGELGIVLSVAIALMSIFALQLHLFRVREREDAHMLRQFQALLSLYHLVPFDAFPPWFTGWAATPELAARIHQIIREERPERVLELGSGASSVVIAAALEKNGVGRLTSIEQDQEYAERTRADLVRHGLSSRAEVVCAPIVETQVDGAAWRWYDRNAIPDIGPIDLLVIDGPHRKLQKMARYPSLPILFDRLSPSATIVLDDAARKDERKAVDRWMETYEGLELEHIDSPKGMAVLRRSAASRTSDRAGVNQP